MPVALCDLEQSQQLELGDRFITLQQPVARGHKIALNPIAAGKILLNTGYL
ncbi:hypothetical protein [Budvicia aquatica]|uniref:hypothetical protein n=1 Tax=Budvicia aquatica TaxID=82979 RepID=UPI002100D9FC|nr:hypothetical protein [Budvicia aquatica]